MDDGVLIKSRSDPKPWLPDKVYFIKDGENANIYVTDDSGNPSRVGNKDLTITTIIEFLNDESNNVFIEKLSGLNWNFFKVNWSITPNLNTVISDGKVYDYILDGTLRHRFVPSPYDPTLDAFYTDFDGTTLTGLITTRG